MINLLVPNFNSEKTIARTLDCFRVQTNKNFKILIRDNCSTDSSPKLINDWMQLNKDINIHFDVAPNHTPSMLNYYRLLERSESSTIQFIDTEDTISSEYIKNIIESSNQTPSDVLLPRFFEWGLNKQVREITILYQLFLLPSNFAFPILLCAPEISGYGYFLYSTFCSGASVKMLKSIYEYFCKIDPYFEGVDNFVSLCFTYRQDLTKKILLQNELFHLGRFDVNDSRRFLTSFYPYSSFKLAAKPELIIKTSEYFIDFMQLKSSEANAVRQLVLSRISYINCFDNLVSQINNTDTSANIINQ
jgi:glycosyltransferase involved in cell wall biosynthesis